MPDIRLTDDLSEMIHYIARHTGKAPDAIVHEALYEAYKLEHGRQGHVVQDLRNLSPWDEPALTAAQMDEIEARSREDERLYRLNPHSDGDPVDLDEADLPF